MKIFTKDPEKATIASIKISQLLFQKKKAHILGECVILPEILIAVETMIGTEYNK